MIREQIQVLLLSAPLAAADPGAGAVAGKVDVGPARLQEQTVVYLADVPGRFEPRTHTVDQRGMRFLPLVIAVAVGDTVDFLNDDGVEHDVYSLDQEAFRLGTLRSGGRASHTFRAPGVYRIRCTFHPDMLGWIFVAPTRFAAPVNRRGEFVLQDVPPGTYRLAVWNAYLDGAERTVTVRAGETADGSFSLAPPRK